MNHQDFRDWLVLDHYDELDPFQEERLTEHLQGCEPCRKRREELQKVFDLVDIAPMEPPAALLSQARRDLWSLVGEDAAQPTPRWWASYLAAAASLLLGVALGFLLFGRAQPQPTSFFDSPSAYGIRNFRVQEAESSDGNIEVLMDLVQPVRLSGGTGDPKIQDALTGALRTSPNPGERMRAVLALESAGRGPWRDSVRSALIHALRSDPNIGVRRRALGLLQESAGLPDVQRALAEVLLNDANPGLRVAAITALSRVVDQSPRLDPELVERLSQSVQHEKNDYIRLQSRAYLQEVRFQ